MVARSCAVRPCSALAGGEDRGADARTIAGLFRRRAAFARLRPRHDLHQKPADAEAGEVVGGDVEAGKQPTEHPVEAVLLWAPRAARRADDSVAGEAAEDEEIAGIDRHAEMDDLAASRLDPRRNDVARIDSGGSAENDEQIDAPLLQIAERGADGLGRVGYSDLSGERRAGGREAFLEEPPGLVEDRRLQRRQGRGDEPDLEGPNGETRIPGPRDTARSRLAAATAKGIVLTYRPSVRLRPRKNSGRVATVTAGSMRLTASTLFRSTTRTPAPSA